MAGGCLLPGAIRELHWHVPAEWIAFADDIVQQFIVHGLTARLSHRLGEGLVNGGFTIRIGIAAGISVSSVQRIWRSHGLQPHRVRQFKRPLRTRNP